MLYERFAAARIRTALTDTPVVLVIGPRRCGKTTLVQIVGGGGRTYITLDDAGTYDYARDNPAGFVHDLDTVTIDEVQRVPELMLAIKKSVDEDRRHGRFLLTGSANVLTLPRVADSLAGRIEVIRLYPLAQCEIVQTTPTFLRRLFHNTLHIGPAQRPRLGHDLIRTVVAGGFPEVLQRQQEERRRRWMENYLESVVTRDLRDIAAIENITALPQFLQFLAQYSGKLVNYSAFGGCIGISHKTAKHYVGLFEWMFLVTRLLPWFTNSLKRLVKTPKLHFLDSGLLAALLGYSSDRILSERQVFGPLLETYAVHEILKLVSFSDMWITPYHFCQHQTCEVDMVLQRQDGMVVGIEVKANTTAKPKDLQGLRQLQHACQNRFACGVILCDREDIVPCGDGLFLAPMSCLWE